MNPGLRDLTSGVWSKVPKVDVEPAIRIVNHETKPNQTKPAQSRVGFVIVSQPKSQSRVAKSRMRMPAEWLTRVSVGLSRDWSR